MRLLCGVIGLLALGLVSGTAVAGLSGSVGPGMITGTLSVTTVVPTTSVPTVTVTLPVTTVTTPTVTTVPVTTSVTLPTTTVVTTAPLPATTTAPTTTTTAPVTTVTSTAAAATVPSGPAGTARGSTTQAGVGSSTEPAPPPDRDASGSVTSASDGAIGTGFATNERRATDPGLQLDRPRPIRPAEPDGAGATSLPRSTRADGSEDEGPRVEAAPVGFIRPGADGRRRPSSAGDLVGELPRNPLGLLLLGLAALLVAIAAIPREAIPARRLGALVADRRVELVSVGVTIFVSAVLTLALA